VLSSDGPGEPPAQAGSPDRGLLRLLRALALIAAVAGTAGSVGLILRIGDRAPGLLLVLFILWVLSPFMALLWASLVSTRWPASTRAILYGVTLLLTLGSLAIYWEVWLRAPNKPAFAFLVVPLGSWLLMLLAVAMARLISPRRPAPE